MPNFELYLLALVIPLIAQIYVSVTYSKSKKIKNTKGISGFDVARAILDKNGLKDMYIVSTHGKMSDHYDPTRKTVKLSTEVFDGEHIASLAIAAHECGHAIQDKEKYLWMKIRSMIFPIVKLGTGFAYVVLFVGLFLEMMNLIWLAIALVSLGLIFQLVTLPVEFDASKRALEELKKLGYVNKEDEGYTKKMLRAAAYTYVAGVLASALEIIRLIIAFTGRND